MQGICSYKLEVVYILCIEREYGIDTVLLILLGGGSTFVLGEIYWKNSFSALFSAGRINTYTVLTS